jgi:hypothetical protein
MVIDIGGPERPTKHRSFKFAGPHYPRLKPRSRFTFQARGQAWLIRRLLEHGIVHQSCIQELGYFVVGKRALST